MSRAKTGSHTRLKIRIIPRKAHRHLQMHVQHIENACSFIKGVNSMTRHKTLRECCPYSQCPSAVFTPCCRKQHHYLYHHCLWGCVHILRTLAVSNTQIQTHTHTQPLVSFEMSAICSQFGEAIVPKGSYSLTGGLLLLSTAWIFNPAQDSGLVMNVFQQPASLGREAPGSCC